MGLRMGKFLKGYAGKMDAGGLAREGYAQGGDSRGLAQVCDKMIRVRGSERR